MLQLIKNLKEKGSRPDNVYRFIENIAKSEPSDKLMTYGKSTYVNELKAMRAEVQQSTEHITQIDIEVNELKQKLEVSRKQLHSAQCALRDITNEKLKIKKQRDRAEKKAAKMEGLRLSLEEDISHLLDQNSDLSMAISAVDYEACSGDFTTSAGANDDFSFQTKCGRRYSPAIRKLYYTLLASQIPTSKVADIVAAVVTCFNPSIDIQHLKLPQRACASYMRREEMKTISNAHKATELCKHASENKGFRMNTDGTTKAQKKIGGVVINDMVVSVNELPDGTAQSVISDISRELEKLRKTAHALKMPNANSINWTLLVSSTSDSASTQKRLNRLVEEHRKADEEVFGPASFKSIDLVENFCSMHLGVNLRKAFLCGIVDYTSNSGDRQHHPVDTFVHEFCKLFGKHGTPEYGCGVLGFQDFLALMCVNSSLSKEVKQYYKSCTSVTLERQIGSRYFLTAANSTKIIFLKEAAVQFLKYTGKDTGNKLERDVYTKLLDPMELARLKADGLMYYHVYADLVMLSKSNDLGKSSLDMNLHYLELKTYLQELEHYPEVVMDKDYTVFTSERELYGGNKKLNHRLHSQLHVYVKLFEQSEHDLGIMCPMISAGAAKMKDKLCTYGHDHLPGGKYWNPDKPDVRKVLSELKPSNDICESILGLNDYLTTAIPNLHQMARSNLVELKRNKTMQWLHDLPEEQQVEVIDLAVDMRQSVRQESKNEEEQREKERRQNMIHAHNRREALKEKAQQERDELSQLNLVTTSEELHQAIADIDNSSISAAKKTAQKRTLVRTQINIRRKVLGQNIRITFSHLRKQRPISEIVKELSQYINQNSLECSDLIQDPGALVGRRISHKFILANTKDVKWYNGTILAYDRTTKTHEILYEGEEEHSYFNLTLDLLTGDLKVLV